MGVGEQARGSAIGAIGAQPKTCSTLVLEQCTAKIPMIILAEEIRKLQATSCCKFLIRCLGVEPLAVCGSPTALTKPRP